MVENVTTNHIILSDEEGSEFVYDKEALLSRLKLLKKMDVEKTKNIRLQIENIKYKNLLNINKNRNEEETSETKIIKAMSKVLEANNELFSLLKNEIKELKEEIQYIKQFLPNTD